MALQPNANVCSGAKKRDTWRSLILIGVVSGLVLACGFLSAWQWGRGQQKQGLALQIQQAQQRAPLQQGMPAWFGLVWMHGHWSSNQLYWDNQVRQGQAGVRVLQMFCPELQNGCIWVDRGWRGRDFRQQPAVSATAGPARLLLQRQPWPNQRPMRLAGQLVQGLSPDELARRWPRASSAALWQMQPAATGLLTMPLPDHQAEVLKHWSYAGQWVLFGLLFLLLGVYALWRPWSYLLKD